MVYLQKRAGPAVMKDAKCLKCLSKRILYQRGKLTCNDCGEPISLGKTNKYGAQRTVSKGKIYDSKFEASEGAQLELRKRAGDIKDFETQYKVEINIYNESGEKVMTVKHKIDFRIHENDGSYTLLEAKGVEMDDWKWRKKLLMALWMPAHPDHEYEVVKENTYKRRRKR